MSIRRHFLTLIAAPLMLLPMTAACAQEASSPVPEEPLSFDEYVQVLAARARAEGVSESTITGMTAGLTANDTVIRLDRAQPGTPTRRGFPPIEDYLSRHVNPSRIAAGRRMYDATRYMTGEIEREYGVPEPILLAIWGHETNYGSYMGDFDLARSLATLAWEGRRRELFASEFVDLLKIADSGFSRDMLKGSWAGAFGNPQFLPSVYLQLAVDGDGDGRKDIWNSRADTLYSIANYFRDAGWRKGQPWGVQARVPAGFNVAAYATEINSPVCDRVHGRHSQWKTVAEWKQLGVYPQRPIGDDVMTSLVQWDGVGERAWLLTGNYRVILEYNCSNYYAMSVGLLADEIER